MSARAIEEPLGSCPMHQLAVWDISNQEEYESKSMKHSFFKRIFHFEYNKQPKSMQISVADIIETFLMQIIAPKGIQNP